MILNTKPGRIVSYTDWVTLPFRIERSVGLDAFEVWLQDKNGEDLQMAMIPRNVIKEIILLHPWIADKPIHELHRSHALSDYHLERDSACRGYNITIGSRTMFVPEEIIEKLNAGIAKTPDK